MTTREKLIAGIAILAIILWIVATVALLSSGLKAVGTINAVGFPILLLAFYELTKE